MPKSTLQLVPFDGAGNLHSHTYAELGVDDIKVTRNGGSDQWTRRASTYWRPAAPFVAKMKLDRLERGRSAATFIWKEHCTPVEYPMFGQWLVDCIQKGVLANGFLTGRWGYAKRGANYSIEFLGDLN